MEVFVIFQRMLMLLTMMALGYISYKKNWLDEGGHKKLSEIVVNIFNPALIINGAISATVAGGADMNLVKENLVYVLIYFSICIAVSIPFSKILGKTDSEKNMFKLMTIFSNVGFMGIPVISSIYGDEAVIFITFYILTYNIILYTLGIYIAQKSIPKEERKSGLKSIINIGTICSVLSVILYFSELKFNDTVLTFFDYVGDATIPLSMMVIGASVAKIPISKIFSDGKLYLFSFLKLLLVPIVMCFVFKGMKNTDMLFGIFILMFAMPVGSIVTMLIKEYGGDEVLCSKATIITTLLSIITIPIVTIFI